MKMKLPIHWCLWLIETPPLLFLHVPFIFTLPFIPLNHTYSHDSKQDMKVVSGS